MRFVLLLFIVVSLSACLAGTEKIKMYEISEGYKFKTVERGNKGYTWIYLCTEDPSICTDLYGKRDSTTSSYFFDIKNIKIDKVLEDTVVFTILEYASGNNFHIKDSLLLGKRMVLSKETIRAH